MQFSVSEIISQVTELTRSSLFAALMSSDDAERVEISLQVAEALLRKNVKATQEVRGHRSRL